MNRAMTLMFAGLFLASLAAPVVPMMPASAQSCMNDSLLMVDETEVQCCDQEHPPSRASKAHKKQAPRTIARTGNRSPKLAQAAKGSVKQESTKVAGDAGIESRTTGATKSKHLTHAGATRHDTVSGVSDKT